MHHHVGQGFGSVKLEENVDVIGDVVHLDHVALLALEDALRIRVQCNVGSLRQHRGTVLGAEDEVDQDLG
jgi:hypothetical protein